MSSFMRKRHAFFPKSYQNLFANMLCELKSEECVKRKRDRQKRFACFARLRDALLKKTFEIHLGHGRITNLLSLFLFLKAGSKELFKVKQSSSETPCCMCCVILQQFSSSFKFWKVFEKCIKIHVVFWETVSFIHNLDLKKTQN